MRNINTSYYLCHCVLSHAFVSGFIERAPVVAAGPSYPHLQLPEPISRAVSDFTEAGGKSVLDRKMDFLGKPWRERFLNCFHRRDGAARHFFQRVAGN